MGMYTLLCLKWISNQDLLQGTGNSAQYCVAAWLRGEFGGKWIHVYVWLSPFPVHLKQFSSVQSLGPVRLCDPMDCSQLQASLYITNLRSLLKLMSTDSVMPSNHLNLCHSLLLLPSIFPSNRVFSNESTLRMRWPKYWSFSFSIILEHPGLISLRKDWLDLLAVQGTLKSLLQHHSSKASILWCSAFFSPTLTSIHDHWKNHSLDQTDLSWQSHVSAFQYAVQVGHNFPFKE